MTTIWILIPDYGYDGYGAPVAAFTTKQKAEEARGTGREAMRDWEIEEVEIDPPKVSR